KHILPGAPLTDPGGRYSRTGLFTSTRRATLGFGRLVRPFHSVLSFRTLTAFSARLGGLSPPEQPTSPVALHMRQSFVSRRAAIFPQAWLLALRRHTPAPASSNRAHREPFAGFPSPVWHRKRDGCFPQSRLLFSGGLQPAGSGCRGWP